MRRINDGTVQKTIHGLDYSSSLHTGKFIATVYKKCLIFILLKNLQHTNISCKMLPELSSDRAPVIACIGEVPDTNRQRHLQIGRQTGINF